MRSTVLAKNLFRLITAVYIFASLFSCSALGIRNKFNKDWISPGEQITYYNSNLSSLQTFSGEGILQIESPTLNESVPLKVLMKMPDSIFVKLEGPLGIDVAKFFMNGENYLLYLPRENELFSGKVSSLDVEELLYDLDVADLDIRENETDRNEYGREIIDFFRGGRIIDPDRLISVNFTDSTRSGNILKLSDISPDTYLEFHRYRPDLQKEKIYGSDEKILVEKSYKRYVRTGNIRLPKQISFTFPGEQSRITIRYTNIKINKKIDPGNFHIDITH